jgi:radical SAM protein with 4Fe4S-binding SPASM domain
MGFCTHGTLGLCLSAGVQCYQSGSRIKKPNMSLSDYKRLIDECVGRTFQVALGGRGDPNEHEDFAELLSYSRKHNIVPNFTTSGYGLTEKQADLAKEYCGAAAVSWYNSEYTLNALKLLLKSGVKSNVHFVLSNSSIDHAVTLLRNKLLDLPEGTNALIFLLHKAVGMGSAENVLRPSDPRVKVFFEEVDKIIGGNIKIGFDSCCVPGLINYSQNVEEMSFDTCEAARWSMYICADMIAVPCSFDKESGFDLKSGTVADAWQSERFKLFGQSFQTACKNCGQKKICLGGCPIQKQIILCERAERTD